MVYGQRAAAIGIARTGVLERPRRPRSAIDHGETPMSAAASVPLFPSFFSATLADTAPEIAAAIRLELGRQQHEIELIASENIVSRAVLEAQGSIKTNKYAEGYPG